MKDKPVIKHRWYKINKKKVKKELKLNIIKLKIG